MGSLSITDAQLQQIVAGAVVAHLDEQQRAGVLTDAVKQILTETRGGYGSKPRIVEAFESAVTNAATAAARAELEKPENQQMLADLVAEGVRKSLERRDEIVSRIAAAITRGFEQR